ncbi:hypothetical protein [Nesterenkonia populi]|uniref:hypothetical protein n=1 Tax=Nesterenkonia populi TaxID=1591087 RepID=UPI0011BE777C|nr:hypothetical protein [Nesterenkonia populi]
MTAVTGAETGTGEFIPKISYEGEHVSVEADEQELFVFDKQGDRGVHLPAEEAWNLSQVLRSVLNIKN